jgi:hypothetical protein
MAVHDVRLHVQSVCVFWKTLDKNVAALQDRGHVLMFEPGAAAVHRKAGTWFDDVEIYEWFGKNLHRVRHPSMRQYVRARELKSAGMDWTEVLAAEAENKRERLAAELLVSDAYESTAAQVKAFVERGGGCRATFFNYRRYLLQKITAVRCLPDERTCLSRLRSAENLALREEGVVWGSRRARIIFSGSRCFRTSTISAAWSLDSGGRARRGSRAHSA